MNDDTRLRDGPPPRGDLAPGGAGQPAANHAQASGTAVYAALDLGTNNCRLLIACPTGESFRVIDSFSRIIRLGEGVSATGCISEAAIDRAISALSICRDKIEAKRATRLRMIATEACRAAANADGFRDRVAAETGIRLEVIDRETEAALAVIGCSPVLDPKGHGAVPFGMGGVAGVAGHIAPFAAEHGGGIGGMHLLGTSGTVTTLAGIHLNLARYDRRRVDSIWMNDSDITATINKLLGMSYEERAGNSCISVE